MKPASIQKKTGIPLIGLGTWRLCGKECESVVSKSLDLGYRHIDTADYYENHEAIGRSIQRFPRQQLFLTTKIRQEDLAPNQVRKAVARFLKELKVGYLDLLLIHWPNPNVDMGKTLKAMCRLLETGVVRAIGVSNFVRNHLRNFLEFPILANQIEMHPYLQRKALAAYCKKQGIGVVAHRPLAKGALEKDPVLREIGRAHGKTASQVALRWLVQQDIAAIPKGSSLKHLKANLDVFDFRLSKEEMQKIRTLDMGCHYCAPLVIPYMDD
jgi:2,5-diketo-D-gluconate reductase B